MIKDASVWKDITNAEKNILVQTNKSTGQSMKLKNGNYEDGDEDDDSK